MTPKNDTPQQAAAAKKRLSWKSKAALAAGVGVPLGLLGTASPAAAWFGGGDDTDTSSTSSVSYNEHANRPASQPSSTPSYDAPTDYGNDSPTAASSKPAAAPAPTPASDVGFDIFDIQVGETDDLREVGDHEISEPHVSDNRDDDNPVKSNKDGKPNKDSLMNVIVGAPGADINVGKKSVTIDGKKYALDPSKRTVVAANGGKVTSAVPGLDVRASGIGTDINLSGRKSSVFGNSDNANISLQGDNNIVDITGDDIDLSVANRGVFGDNRDNKITVNGDRTNLTSSGLNSNNNNFNLNGNDVTSNITGVGNNNNTVTANGRNGTLNGSGFGNSDNTTNAYGNDHEIDRDGLFNENNRTTSSGIGNDVNQKRGVSNRVLALGADSRIEANGWGGNFNAYGEDNEIYTNGINNTSSATGPNSRVESKGLNNTSSLEGSGVIHTEGAFANINAVQTGVNGELVIVRSEGARAGISLGTQDVRTSGYTVYNGAGGVSTINATNIDGIRVINESGANRTSIEHSTGVHIVNKGEDNTAEISNSDNVLVETGNGKGNTTDVTNSTRVTVNNFDSGSQVITDGNSQINVNNQRAGTIDVDDGEMFRVDGRRYIGAGAMELRPGKAPRAVGLHNYTSEDTALDPGKANTPSLTAHNQAVADGNSLIFSRAGIDRATHARPEVGFARDGSDGRFGNSDTAQNIRKSIANNSAEGIQTRLNSGQFDRNGIYHHGNGRSPARTDAEIFEQEQERTMGLKDSQMEQMRKSAAEQAAAEQRAAVDVYR